MQFEKNKIYCGDCLKLIKDIPDNSIDCVITSPPYWGLRDYKSIEQIGLEQHPSEYIEKIVAFMKEAKRVIKPTGTIFLNLGDSFYTKSGSGQGSNFLKRHEILDGNEGNLSKAHSELRGKFKSNWLQSKQKLLIPYRIAIKCQDELGLILRNDLHWIKQFVNVKTKESYGSSVPSSVQDRFNTNSESIFFFVKSKKYYFNLNAIRFPHKISSIKRYSYSNNQKDETPYSKQLGIHSKNSFNPLGKNPGDCLHFPFEPRKVKHFAMFPTLLPYFFIQCGCPKNGIVLDPFIGSGTTASACIVAKRNFIGFDSNKIYCDFARETIKFANKTATREQHE